ncbi:MAG TPA: V-type ATP synthase subunit E family protein [Candidatus Thermoplasmatota archaeon]
MGLEVVLNQILSAGQKEESNLLEQAQFERERILSEAQGRADELRRLGDVRTQARIEALKREILSAAEFEARRRNLVARRELSEDFRNRVLAALKSLPEAQNQKLLSALVKKAREELSTGAVRARKHDLPFLTKAGFQAGDELPGVGGFMVDSADGHIVLDFRYETLLDNAWKRILSEHQSLFEE